MSRPDAGQSHGLHHGPLTSGSRDLATSAEARVITWVETRVEAYAPASTMLAKVSSIARPLPSHVFALANHARERAVQ